LTVHGPAANRLPGRLPPCSVLASPRSPLSERYRLAVTAFAARRLDVSHKRKRLAEISKTLIFDLRSDFRKILEHELKPFCTEYRVDNACFNRSRSHGLISTGKWNKEKKQSEQKRRQTRKDGNCDALQLEASQRRASRFSLFQSVSPSV